MQETIYEYSKPTEFLLAALKEKQRTNPRFSLRAWSDQIGFSSPATLSLILNKKRKLKPQQAVKIRKALQLDPDASRYFDLLVQYEGTRSIEEKEFYESILNTLRPEKKFSPFDLDQFRLISDWYHIALLEMVKLADFQEDPKWICKRLTFSISPTQIREAIERLMRLGFLKRLKGRLVRTRTNIETPTDIPSEGLRHFHAQMIQHALVALKTQPIHERDITAHTMVVSKAKLKQAKQIIRQFRKKLANFFESAKNGDEIYQLNIQLFKLTNKGPKS